MNRVLELFLLLSPVRITLFFQCVSYPSTHTPNFGFFLPFRSHPSRSSRTSVSPYRVLEPEERKRDMRFLCVGEWVLKNLHSPFSQFYPVVNLRLSSYLVFSLSDDCERFLLLPIFFPSFSSFTLR